MLPTSILINSSSCLKSIAPVGQNFSQALHVPLMKYVQFSLSITGKFGTACANGVYTAFRYPSPASYTSSITFFGHFSWQIPQPVQSSSLTKRAFFLIVTLKLPTKPVTFTTSLHVSKVMFGCVPASTIRGVRMHAEQSSVGKVLSNCAMCPPMDGSRSTK